MDSLAIWRDVAVLLLAIEAFVLGLVPAAILYLCVRGMTWLLSQLRRQAPVVQGYFHKASAVTESVSQRIASPMIAASASAAQARRMRSTLFGVAPWSSSRTTKEV